MSNENSASDVSLLCVKSVAALFGLSVRQIWRLVSAKQFPQPVHVGRAARWRLADLKAYLDNLK